MTQKTHISQFADIDKSAENLATQLDPGDDWYHQNIVRAAKALVANGRKNCQYHTQWGSGATLWDQEWPPQSVRVDIEGNITVR